MMANLPIFEAAMGYLGMGVSVIPTHSIVDGHCTCPIGENCDDAGKHPIIPWTPYQSRRPSPMEVEGWFAKYRSANLGIITGRVSNLFVVDVDGRKGLASISGKQIPTTPTVKTGGGGYHFYYKLPDDLVIRNRIGMLPGIDIRGEGGFVTAPPSRHISGGTYQWADGRFLDDCSLADPPDWLVEMLVPNRSNTLPLSIKPHGKRRSLLPCAYAFVMQGTDEGDRDKCMFTLAKHCRQAGLNEEEAQYFLGMANCNCRPPLPPYELQIKLASAYRGRCGTGYTSLDCDEPAWTKYCSKSACPVAKSRGILSRNNICFVVTMQKN